MGKRSCRRTEDAKRIHEKAVKMRKMTDEQLVHYVEDRISKAENEGYNQVKKESGQSDIDQENYTVKYFLEGFRQVPGVGKITYKRLVDYAKEKGYIPEE